MKTDRRNWRQLVVALLLLWGCLSGRANVYATNIKLNGSTNNAAVSTNNAAARISYILNEPATAGVTVRIVSNGVPLWTTNLAGGMAGTGAGSNSLTWDGTDQTGAGIAPGIYRVSITAAAAGYAAWTNITDDSAIFSVPDPISIAVNRNTNSPYYGRVFVGNDTPDYDNNAGICKFNADGSPADEGGFSQSYPWYNNPDYFYSPWKIAVAEDDTVYISDWEDDGPVLAFDEVISTNYLTVLGSGNYSYSGQLLSGPCVVGGGAGTRIWMSDVNWSGGSVGVVEWDLAAGGVLAPTDTGTVVVGISPSGVNVCPWDMSVDASGNIYVIQCLDGVLYPEYYSTNRLFCFPPHPGNGPPDLTPTWSLNSTNLSLENAVDIAVDPTGLLLAVAVNGYNNGGDIFQLTNGAVNLYCATNGALAARLGTNDEFWGVAWDNVGNLYATDLAASVWRAYSPPGANQAATTAAPILQVYDTLTQPILSAPAAVAGQFGFTLTGQSNVTYIIQGSLDLANWTPVATNYATVDVRTVTLPAPGCAGFFRAVVP
ncbi:MAG: hypothetical protein ABSC18_14155 [Verrucomicrobiota bacterium]|jgi:hypothetical protein